MANRYWVGGTGTWNATSTTNWSATNGGAGGASAPTSADAVIFSSASGTGTCTTAAGATCSSMQFDGGISNISIVLGANLTMPNGCTFISGVMDLQSYTFTCSSFSSNNSNNRTVAFGTGNITVTRDNGTAWNTDTATNFVVTGTPVVNATYAGSTGTRTFTFGGTSGGTEANSVSLNILSGSDTVSIYGSGIKNLDFTGFSGTLASLAARTIYGNLLLSTGMAVSSSTFVTTFGATSGVKTITTNGKALDFPVAFNGIGGSWKLIDNLTVGSTRTVTLTNGTLDGNGKNVSLGSFALGSGTKTLTLGSGTWTVTGSGTAWNANTNATGLTVSDSTGTINMTSASAKTFAGGGKMWPTLNQGGAGALTIQQSNTFTNITNTVQPATITLTSGSTQTVTSFGVSGTAGNLITLNSSSAGSQATLSDNSGVNSVSYTTIKDINATGGSIWDAPTTAGNVDAGNNLGWNFGIPFNYDIEFSPALRSFTERKQF